MRLHIFKFDLKNDDTSYKSFKEDDEILRVMEGILRWTNFTFWVVTVQENGTPHI